MLVCYDCMMIYFRAKALCQRAHLEGAEARLGLKKVRSTRSRHLVTSVTCPAPASGAGALSLSTISPGKSSKLSTHNQVWKILKSSRQISSTSQACLLWQLIYLWRLTHIVHLFLWILASWGTCWCRVSCRGHFGSAATSTAVVTLAQSPHQRPGVGKMLSATAQINHKPRVWASGSRFNPQLFSVDWYVYCELSELVPMTSFRHLFNCTASQSGLAVTPAPKINSHEAM